MDQDKKGTQFLVFVPTDREYNDEAVLEALKQHLRLHLPELTFYVSYEPDIGKVPRGPGEYRVFPLKSHKTRMFGVEFMVSTAPFENPVLERQIHRTLYSFASSRHRRRH